MPYPPFHCFPINIFSDSFNAYNVIDLLLSGESFDVGALPNPHTFLLGSLQAGLLSESLSPPPRFSPLFPHTLFFSVLIP